MTVADLARKYAALLALREAHARGAAVAERATLRALAHEFPSALKELDTLPLDEIRDRVARLDEAARDPSRVEPWMPRMVAWHLLMAATLHLKRKVSHRTALSDDDARALAREASVRAGLHLDADYVRGVEAPPRGRLALLVFQRLGAHFDEDPMALWQSLFPTTREDRFRPKRRVA